MKRTVDPPPNSYSGSFRTFFEKYIFPILPNEEAILAWHDSLVRYLDSSPTLFIARKTKVYNHRGRIYETNGGELVCSDNEPAIWVYMKCFLGNPAIHYMQLLKEQMFPIAYCYKAEEKALASWKRTGRMHPQFSDGGWKLAHILACSKGCQTSSIESRMLRLLSPLNHFPFPSPRRFSTRKAWEEDEHVLRLTIHLLAHELGSKPRRTAFQEFIKRAGGAILLWVRQMLRFSFKGTLPVPTVSLIRTPLEARLI